MDYEITIDDPKVFTRPFTVKTERLLAPDTDLLEDVCENERDQRHMSGDTGIRLRPELVATYAGVYELAPGREFTITATEDLLFVRGLNEPRFRSSWCRKRSSCPRRRRPASNSSRMGRAASRM